MPAPDLQSWLAARTTCPRLWQAGEVCVDAPGVLDWLHRSSSWRDSFRGKSLAISGSTNLFHMLALVALDGNAGSILLLPPGLAQNVSAEFMAKAGAVDVIAENSSASALNESTGTREHQLPPFVSAQGLGPNETGRLESNEPSIQTRWLLPTSGTTGVPKLVPHTLESLTRTTKRDVTRGAELRWGLLYELTRFAGLQVFLQALAGGSVLLVPPPGSPLPEQVRFLAHHKCNALSATPTLWRKLMMDANISQLPLRHITLGGEIADDRVLSGLKGRFPEAAIRHIYASTEAGVGFTVSDGRAGFPAAFLAEPPPGLALRIREPEGMLLMRPAGATPAGYADRDDRIQDEDGWIETGDLVSLEGDRVLFLGRASGAINVGGAKVHPDEVETCLRQLPWVAEALVRGRKNPFSGNVVEAILVPAPDRLDGRAPADRAQEAREHCRRHLEPFKIPAVVHIQATLPTTTTGKLERA